jgi:peroxiredoxin Q/BCP
MLLPKFSLPASDGKTYSQKDFDQGTFVLYIYPKDMTSGCTIEAHNFRDAHKEFKHLHVKVFGLSADPIKSHEKFCEKESLNFPLLSDESLELLKALDVWKEKSLYGKKYWGAERSTFIIKDGKIVKEWRKVTITGHVEEVLEAVK